MRPLILLSALALTFISRLSASEVSDFGAIGDGLADDTDAVQAAVEAGWGSVRFEKGAYRITKTITVKLDDEGPLSLLGDGTARIIMAGKGPAFRIIGTHGGTADPASVKHEVFDHQRMPLIDGIEIVGANPEADGIEAKGTMQLTITRVNIRDCRHAIHLVERNRNIIIANSHLYKNRGIGVFYDAVNLHQSNITGCHISYCAGGGVVSRGGEVRNVQISGCDIEANMATEAIMGEDAKNAPASANVELDSRGGSIAEVAITGCTLQHTGKVAGSANVHIIGPGDDKRVTSESGVGKTREGNVTISSNVMSDVRINVHIEHARGVTILGNTFWEGFDYDLVVENSSEVAVTGNVFDRNPRYALWQKEAPKQGLLFEHCADCTLSGVHINGVRDHEGAVVIRDSRRFLITGCSILDSDGPGILMEGVKHSRVGMNLISDERRTGNVLTVLDKGGEGNVTDGK